MDNKRLAKSHPRETIEEHTGYLLKNYDTLKNEYPDLKINWEILRLAVLFHDLGKLNTRFQNKLYRKLKLPLLVDDGPGDEEIPHGNLSAAFLDKQKLKDAFDGDDLKILYQAIYYHHPRHIDKSKKDFLKAFIKSDLSRYIALDNIDLPFITKEPKGNFNSYIKKRIDYTPGDDWELFFRYVLTKGLLNRLDYAASGHIVVENPNRDLENKTLSFLEKKGGLREIQQYLLQHQEENNVVVASTGIGKTEAGLLWIGNNKGFFTLPLRVSINAIYTRIKRDDIGYNETALLHSDALSFLLKNTESNDYLIRYTRARQLSEPLTITTVDQLFKFVFKQEGFEPVLATLSYSKIIIDEIQMYSPEIVACILMGLKYISKSGGKFSILTATFPGVLHKFLKELGITYNYKEFILDRERHKVALMNTGILESVDEIIEMGKHSKVLVIVNTVRKAQEVYEALGDCGKKSLLHSRFIKRDRARREKEIMDFSTSDETGIWVTTQIVEASLDIDFDMLYTELSTIDGLFQRMGRCYRKRELKDHHINVKVFIKAPSGKGKIFDHKIFDLSKAALKRFDKKRISEKEKLAVVDEVYSLEKIKNTEYYKGIRDRLDFLEMLPAYQLDRNEVDKNFRNISSHTVIPISIHDKNKEGIRDIIGELDKLGYSPEDKTRRVTLLDEIKQLTVDVPYYLSEHIGEEFSIDRNNTIKIINLGYDASMGLKNKKG
ncbi:MAG: CRISPR-associated helicase Cas3' [bacterium]|nr:CRISPR-associated helicase Cas3' [bacterium]